MCLDGTTAAVRHHHHEPADTAGPVNPTRRRFLAAGAAAAGGVLATVSPVGAIPAMAAQRARRVVDLTHRLVTTFPTFDGAQPEDEIVNDFGTTGFYSKRWAISEHTGTHVDSPGHFTEGLRLVDDLEAGELIAPIVVIDISRRAREDPNAVVEPEDVLAFERRHGRIPPRALVCMDSGWARKADDPDAFRGGPGFPDFAFPGFGIEAAMWLAARRDPVGIGVDTLSLDPGNSLSFDVHLGFLGSDRYGVENLANLHRIPPRGATAYVGVVPWEDGSGAPCRVVATW